MKFKTILLSLILTLAAVSALAQSSNKDEATFKSLIKQMTDAQLAYDAAALDKIFTADYIEISPVGEFDPREKVLGFYTPEAKAAAGKMSAKLDVTDFSIRQYDKFAIVISKFTYMLENEGKPLPPRSMRVMTVFRKEKDAWKAASAQYTGIRSTPPAAK
ncbi:MAG: nuclear transport factor 2 family protein [Pyrinomonadaceae bacterium]